MAIATFTAENAENAEFFKEFSALFAGSAVNVRTFVRISGTTP
jgi:hypothetical protein